LGQGTTGDIEGFILIQIEGQQSACHQAFISGFVRIAVVSLRDRPLRRWLSAASTSQYYLRILTSSIKLSIRKSEGDDAIAIGAVDPR
jgi:hypothetical protein